MTPEQATERLRTLEKSIAELLKKQDALYPGDFFNSALELAAQRGDAQCIVQGKSGDFEHALGETLSTDKRIDEEREQGSFAHFSADKHSQKELPTVINAAQHISRYLDDGICCYPFIRESIIGKNLTQGLEKWDAREQDMSVLPPEVKALVYAHLMRNTAEQKLRARAQSLLHESTRLDLLQKDPKDYWSEMLAGDPSKSQSSPMFALHFGKRVSGKILEKAKAFFGSEEAAKRALNALAAVTYVTKKDYRGRDFSEFRASVYEAVGQKDIAKAENILTEKVQKYPNAFTPTAQKAFMST
ncbi:hypothetical protein HY620_02910 [Candidatus Uhrbacteria bacterium]|nr:hypothetical protein [Candidatus Uhrbacteria bacterium]